MSVDAATTAASHSANGGRKLRLLTLDDLDGRTRARQRAEELRERCVAERGGTDCLDVMRATHASTWAILSTMIEDQMARFLLGEAVEPSTIATLVNARRREGEALGEPEPRDVTDSLPAFLADLAREKSAAGESNAPQGQQTAGSGANRMGDSPPANGGAFREARR